MSKFAVDWERRAVTCPAGQTSRSWNDARRDEYPYCQIAFRKADRRACPLRPREEHVALQLARQRQAVGDFAARYRTLPKVRLEHVAIAVGISLQRLDA